jgi:membrane fusion protein (multidrug efflux system)
MIDRSTGTITIRGEVPNPDYTIFPGQICRVRIPLWKTSDAVLVKTEAVRPDLNHDYVFVVDEKNIAHRRIVKLGNAQSDGTCVVEEGLQKGDRYVVRGVQKVRDGNKVKAAH